MDKIQELEELMRKSLIAIDTLTQMVKDLHKDNLTLMSLLQPPIQQQPDIINARIGEAALHIDQPVCNTRLNW